MCLLNRYDDGYDGFHLWKGEHTNPLFCVVSEKCLNFRVSCILCCWLSAKKSQRRKKAFKLSKSENLKEVLLAKQIKILTKIQAILYL